MDGDLTLSGCLILLGLRIEPDAVEIDALLPGTDHLVPVVEDGFVIERVPDRFRLGRAGLLAKPAVVALAEIDRIPGDFRDFLAGFVRLVLESDAGGWAGGVPPG